MLRSAVPTFVVSDVAETVAWYVQELGFELTGAFPEEAPFAFASVQRDGAEIMFLAVEGYEKPDLRDLRPSGLWDAYIRMNGVHYYYRCLDGASFVQMSLREQPYGDWEFEVVDPNGYVLTFGGTY